MPKILLVEDDNNLREIYEMLLTAEGYNILTAGDGEEGLSAALKEKPDLIIADVMMPKLSGFEMLENLKAAPEMKDVKVIMMTALGQAEDQARASQLGVVKYLVKSQATLEDFARVVKEVLPPASGQTVANNQPKDSSKNNQEGERTMQEDTSTNNLTGSDSPADGAAPSAPTNPMGDDAGAGSGQMNAAQEQSEVNEQVNDFAATPASDQPDDTSASFNPTTPPADDSSAADSSADDTAADAPADSTPSMDETPDANPPTSPPDEPMATPPQSDNPA